MPKDIPAVGHETPLRRQITSFNIGVELDTKETPSQLPAIAASVSFTDLYTNGNGDVVAYPVPDVARISGAELLAVPHALEVIAALQQLAYDKAIEQGV